MRLALGVVSLRALRASFILLKNSSGFSTFPVTASEVVPSESSFIFSSMLLAVTETSGTGGFSFAPPVSGLLGFVLELPPEVPGLEVFPPEVPESEGFSTGVVACPLSSSEPLEPSEHEVNESARLSARMHAKIQWGGNEVEVKFHCIS